MALGMVGPRLFMKSAPSLTALQVMNTLFACMGRWPREDGCQPLDCLEGHTLLLV